MRPSGIRYEALEKALGDVYDDVKSGRGRDVVISRGLKALIDVLGDVAANAKLWPRQHRALFEEVRALGCTSRAISIVAARHAIGQSDHERRRDAETIKRALRRHRATYHKKTDMSALGQKKRRNDSG